MMSARIIRTPSLSASSCASLVTGTSNARIMPNFLQPCKVQQHSAAHGQTAFALVQEGFVSVQ